jgi:small subunit ribosomal protein S1
VIGNDRRTRQVQLSIKAKDYAEESEAVADYNRQSQEASSGTTRLGALLREQLGQKGE